MLLVAVGLAVGLVSSVWATDLIQSFLFGVGSTDPITFLVTALGLVAVGVIACLVPAWRAMRADPVFTLRAG